MALEFKKAKRSLAKARIAVSGVSGSGKTASSLLLAFGLVKAEHPQWSDEDVWNAVCIIDTENASGSLYVGSQMGVVKIGSYNTIDIDPPFTTDKYIEAIHLAENNDQECIIIDSMSQAWSSTGGALERQQQISQRTNNSYTAWAPVKKEMKAMMDAILQSKSHIISCFRAKQEYVQEKNEKGKTVVRNVGLGLVYMDAAEYEYAVHFTLDQDHNAFGQKDRTGIFQNKFEIITPETGRRIAEWLKGDGSAPAPVPKASKPEMKPAAKPAPIAEEAKPLPGVTMEEVDGMYAAVKGVIPVDELKQTIKGVCGTLNYRKVEDPAVLARLFEALKAKGEEYE